MSRILVIDDEDVIRMLVMEILETAGPRGNRCRERRACARPARVAEFELVVSDVIMPGLSGLELLEAVRARSASLPVVLVTGAGTYDTLSQALTRGAAGLVTKPFAHADLQAAVADALERASRSREDLRERLLAPTLASALANAIEARDAYLHGHCERLAALAVRARRAARAAGRRGGDDSPRGDPSRHRQDRHPRPGPAEARGARRGGAPDHRDASRDRRQAARATRAARRRPADRPPPPRALGRQRLPRSRWPATAIPLGARIVAVADSVEVMSSRQLYRQPRTPEQIVTELRAWRGAQWDPQIVDLVLELIESGELPLGADGLHLLEQAAGEPSLPATAGPARRGRRRARLARRSRRSNGRSATRSSRAPAARPMRRSS